MAYDLVFYIKDSHVEDILFESLSKSQENLGGKGAAQPGMGGIPIAGGSLMYNKLKNNSLRIFVNDFFLSLELKEAKFLLESTWANYFWELSKRYSNK